MHTRRNFIQTSLMAAAWVLSAKPVLSRAAGEKNKLENIGFISGIIGKELKADWKEALKKAAGFGFNEYEGSLQGDSLQDFLQYCKDIGIKPVAGGAKFSLDMDEVKMSFDKLNELDMEYAVVYWPWQVSAPFRLDDCKRSSELLNQMGELALKHGLKLCWHNHDKEFTEMEEGLPFHYLMKHTDQALVKCEMDIYWVAKGGAVPLDILKQYPGRFPILHVKDMAGDADQTFECPGSGIIGFPAIFDEAHRQGIRHYMVERDNVVDGMSCLKSSGEYLRKLRF